MNTLLPEDLQWITNRLPKLVRAEMKRSNGGLALAGGFIRACIAREEVNDIDLFVPNAAAGDVAAKALTESKDADKKRRIVKTQNAITILGHKYTIQIITRWSYERPEDILPSFDFTIAKAAVWYRDEKWQSLTDERFYPDLAAKRLVYTSPERNEDAGGSMLRMLKFYRRGYTAALPSVSAVIARLLKGVDAKSSLFWEGCNNDRTFPPYQEVENYRAKILCGLLREVDPNVDPDHIAHAPSATETPEEPEETTTL